MDKRPRADLQPLLDVMARLRSPEGCPWDRQQTHESLKRYLLEESYELLDAIDAGDDTALVEELGDVLLQVVFHAQIAAETGRFSMADVIDVLVRKLIRRHPHVFGTVEAETAGQVLANWDRIKEGEEGRERGVFAEVPENLPGPLLARKVQRRAASSGFDPLDHDERVDAARGTLEAVAQEATPETIGDALFALVNVARGARIDPELALRASAARFRARVEAAVALAEAAGESWSEISEERRLDLYVQARLNEDQESQ